MRRLHERGAQVRPCRARQAVPSRARARRRGASQTSGSDDVTWPRTGARALRAARECARVAPSGYRTMRRWCVRAAGRAAEALPAVVVGLTRALRRAWRRRQRRRIRRVRAPPRATRSRAPRPRAAAADVSLHSVTRVCARGRGAEARARRPQGRTGKLAMRWHRVRAAAVAGRRAASRSAPRRGLAARRAARPHGGAGSAGSRR
jgi:hypothetical protein